MTGRGLSLRLAAQVGSLALDAELDVGSGSLALVGPNGAGKSSLLLLALGALSPRAGRVTLHGDVLFDAAAPIDLPTERRQLGYVPQDYALFPHLTVRGNLAFAAAVLPRAQRVRRVDELLTELDLLALADRAVTNLSGGERQRVALARALAAGPRALLLDEPLAALDVDARRGVRTVLMRTLSQLALPTLFVSHDLDDVRALATRIAVLEAGRITQVGTFDELVAQPATPFVARFVRGA